MIDFALAGIKWGLAVSGFVAALAAVVAVTILIIVIGREVTKSWVSYRAHRRELLWTLFREWQAADETDWEQFKIFKHKERDRFSSWQRWKKECDFAEGLISDPDTPQPRKEPPMRDYIQKGPHGFDIHHGKG